MSDSFPTPAAHHHAFVDEAGDGVLFARRGKVIVGTEGCSQFFILGRLVVADPPALERDLAQLRTDLLTDPYFHAVPSMRPEAKKTALAFHANDDLPEVRREVFRVLMRHNLSFDAVARDKHAVLSFVTLQGERDATYRYRENELYDALVRRLFREGWNAAAWQVRFAKRGKSERTAALREAIAHARRDREEEHHGEFDVLPMAPKDAAGLQAVDYFLWALQRHCERKESRFLELIWPKVGRVILPDDARRHPHGETYGPTLADPTLPAH